MLHHLTISFLRQSSYISYLNTSPRVLSWAFTIHVRLNLQSHEHGFNFLHEMGATSVHRHPGHTLFCSCYVYIMIQIDSWERATQVESSCLRSWSLADDMGLGKTMSTLAGMLMCTRDQQLVEFSSSSNPRTRINNTQLIQTALLAICKAASRLLKHWTYSLIYTSLTTLTKADASFMHELQRSSAMGLDTGT